MTSVSAASFLAGMSVGLTVAVPIGPMGMLCIQRTLAQGMIAGLGTGLAAATVQVSYGAMALLGLSSTMLAFVGASASTLSAASGVVLLWFALRTSRCKPEITSTPPVRGAGFMRSFRQALVLGFANPMAMALFLAAFPAFASSGDSSSSAALVAGIFVGAAGWYVCLSGTVSVARVSGSLRAVAFTNRLIRCGSCDMRSLHDRKLAWGRKSLRPLTDPRRLTGGYGLGKITRRFM